MPRLRRLCDLRDGKSHVRSGELKTHIFISLFLWSFLAGNSCSAGCTPSVTKIIQSKDQPTFHFYQYRLSVGKFASDNSTISYSQPDEINTIVSSLRSGVEDVAVTLEQIPAHAMTIIFFQDADPFEEIFYADGIAYAPLCENFLRIKLSAENQATVDVLLAERLESNS